MWSLESAQSLIFLWHKIERLFVLRQKIWKNFNLIQILKKKKNIYFSFGILALSRSLYRKSILKILDFKKNLKKKILHKIKTNFSYLFYSEIWCENSLMRNFICFSSLHLLQNHYTNLWKAFKMKLVQ